MPQITNWQRESRTPKLESESVTMGPPTRPTFKVKAEREGPAEGLVKLSIEFELEGTRTVRLAKEKLETSKSSE